MMTMANEYKKQRDSRTVKVLIFTYHKEVDHPAYAGIKTVVEKMAKLGDTIPLDELTPASLEKGERLGAFYTDAELKAAESGSSSEGEGDEGAPNFSEMGEFELAEHLKNEKPNVQDTVAMAGDDSDLAARILEAEGIASSGDPRSGVVDGLNKIIEAAAADKDGDQ